MLLQELTGVKKYSKLTGKALINKLYREHKIKAIGQGAYAVVFEHPSWNYVLKIFQDDPCYLAFIKWVKAQAENEHLPKIVRSPKRVSSFFTRPSAHQEFYGVKLERLEELTFEQRDLLDDLDRYLNKILNKLKAKEDPSDVIKWFSTKVKVSIDDLEDKIQISTLLTTILEIDASMGGGCALDLHVGNFMRRGSTIVIIDPFYGYGELEPTLINDFIDPEEDAELVQGRIDQVKEIADKLKEI